MHERFGLGILMILMMLAGCRPDEVCRQDLSIAAGVVLRGTSVDSAGVVSNFTSWDSITVQGVGSDSVLYNNAKSVKTLYLPLRPDTALTMYRLNWHGEEDILYVRHDNTRRYVSMACGCIIYHTIDTVWSDGVWIDSVEIMNSAVESASQNNIRIYTSVEE